MTSDEDSIRANIYLYTDWLQEFAKPFPGVRVVHNYLFGKYGYRWDVQYGDVLRRIGTITPQVAQLNVPDADKRLYLQGLLMVVLREAGITP